MSSESDYSDLNFSSSEEESGNESEEEISETESISSDDSTKGTHHWHTSQLSCNDITTMLKEYCDIIGLNKNLTYTQIIELIFTNEVLDKFIDATSEHGKNDDELPNIAKDNAGRALIKAFIAMEIHRLQRNVPIHDVHSPSKFRGLPDIAKVASVMYCNASKYI